MKDRAVVPKHACLPWEGGGVTLPPAPTGRKLVISLHQPTCSAAANIFKFILVDLWAAVLPMASSYRISISPAAPALLHRHSLMSCSLSIHLLQILSLYLCFSRNPPAAYRQASREHGCVDIIVISLTHKQELCEATTQSQ